MVFGKVLLFAIFLIKITVIQSFWFFGLRGTVVTLFRILSVIIVTAWKVSKYGVFSGPYFPAFGLNTPYLSVFSLNVGKYGLEKTPYLDTFHAVLKEEKIIAWLNWCIWVYCIYCRKHQFTFIRQNIYKIV